MAKDRESRELWMRPVSFAGLLRILKAVAGYSYGLRAGEINALISEKRLYLTRAGRSLAPTPLYHLRTTLIELSALRRVGRRLVANRDNLYVGRLLDQPMPVDTELTQEGRDAWAALVLANSACRSRFFDLFMPGVTHYDLQKFRSQARSVIWRRDDPNRSDVVLTPEDPAYAIRLSSPLAFQSLLYGIRYWARDELALLDEFFRLGSGSIMYPIDPTPTGRSPAEVARDIPERPDPVSDWTLLSLMELAAICCQQRRRPLADLHAMIAWLARTYAGWVVLIPTSPRAATLTARSAVREDYELRGLYRDGQGQYISHIRLHRKLFPVLAGGAAADEYVTGEYGAQDKSVRSRWQRPAAMGSDMVTGVLANTPHRDA